MTTQVGTHSYCRAWRFYKNVIVSYLWPEHFFMRSFTALVLMYKFELDRCISKETICILKLQRFTTVFF